MKKIFSAFLLMTMMVASVGSFVSCSDIEESIAAVDEATKNNAASIKDLEGKIAALQTALQTAQSEAAAAKAEANAAKQAAATAKAEAIAAALAEIEKVNGDVDAVNAEIKKINDALAGCATKEAVELLQATIDEYKALIDANGDATTANAEAIAAIEEALAAIGENVTPEQLAEVVAKMTAIDQALVAFQNRLQSVSYVPEWKDGPTAVLFEENEEYGYVHMSYEVAPAAYASKITAENTKLVGVALKGVEVEEHDVKILSADPETGIVEVIAYIGVDSKVWEAKADANGKAVAAVALRVVAEDAQFTSAYTNVNVLGGDKAAESINDYVFFGTYNEDDEFVTNVYDEEKEAYQPVTLTHTVSYDTPVADSEVALFEGLVARVNVPGFFEYVPVEEAAEMFGIEIKVTEKLSSFATKYFVTTVTEYNWVEDDDDEPETPAFIVAKDQTLDITVKFNETVVDSLKKAENLTSYKNAGASAALKAGYFQVNGEKAVTFAGLTAVYDVVGPEKNLELVLNNNETINVEWTPKNYSERATLEIEDLDVTGGNARMLDEEITFDYTPLDKDGEPMAKSEAPAVTVEFISIDNADVTIDLTKWPVEATTYAYAFEGWYLDTETDTKVIVTFDVTFAVEAAPEQIGEVPASAVTVALVKSGVEVEADETPWPATTVDLTGVVEKILPYYKEYFASEKKAKEEIIKKLSPENGVPVSIRVVNATSGEIAETITGAATYKYSVNATTKAETSKITIPYEPTVYGKMSKKYVQFAFDVDIFGIVATVTADCEEVSKWVEYKAPTITLVEGKFDSETLKGTNPYEWATKNTFWTDQMGTPADTEDDVKHNYNYVEVSEVTAGAKYSFINGNYLKLSDFISIANAEGENLADYYVRISNVSAPRKGAGTATDPFVYDYATVAEVPYIDGVNGTIQLYVPATAADVAASATDAITHVGQNIVKDSFNASYLSTAKLYWNGSNVNEISFTAELVKASTGAAANAVTSTIKVNGETVANPDYINALPVKFATPKAINSLEIVGTDVAYEYKHGEVLNIKFAKHIKVTDLFGKQVNNTYGDWRHVWAQYAWDVYGDGVDVNGNSVTEPAPTVDEPGKYGSLAGTTSFFQAYGQTISFVGLVGEDGTVDPAVKIECSKDFTKGTATYNSATGVVEVTDGDYGFHEERGIIAVNSNLANINGEVTFTVRVELPYMNDNYKPYTQNITVKVVNAQ